MLSALKKIGVLHHLLLKNVLFSIVVFIFVNHPIQNICAQISSAESQWSTEKVAAGVVEPPALYFYALKGGERIWHMQEDFRAGQLYGSLYDLLVAEVIEINSEKLSGLSEAELKQVAFNNNVIYYVTDFSALGEQVWALSLETEQGGQGRLDQRIDMAYSSYNEPAAGGVYADGEHRENYDGLWLFDRQVRPFIGQIRPGEDDVVNTVKEFVGDYFFLDQFALNSGGLTKRYISVGSNWSLSFLKENVMVVGSSAVRDTFMMDNREPKWDLLLSWCELF
jgi:hypothetical protein